MILSILIPTYNRIEFLLKNLKELSDYIEKSVFKNNIEIIISNNCSTDTTHNCISEFLEANSQLKLRYFCQKSNIGLEENALFVLEQSKSKYVMYLGDDDFISFDYLEGAINHIIKHKFTFSVIPAFYNIDLEGNRLGLGRDNGFSNKVFSAGFDNCFINSWRGHQLSGLVFKREGTLNSYRKNKVKNIYLFIYFIAFNCMRGNTYHFPQFPVKVTQLPQEGKDWTYGDDGLFNDVFDNFKKLQITELQKTKLQLSFYKKQSWRLWNYKKISIKKFILAYNKIWFASNSTFLFKVLFPIVVFKHKMYYELKNLLK